MTDVERRSNGGLKVIGLATTGFGGQGAYGGYGNQGYGGQYGGYGNQRLSVRPAGRCASTARSIRWPGDRRRRRSLSRSYKPYRRY